MVRKVISPVTGGLVIALLLAGCQSKKRADNEVRLDSVAVERNEPLLTEDNSPACQLKVKLVYPADYADREVLKAMQQSLNRTALGEAYADLTPVDAAAHYAEQYVKDYKELAKDYVADVKEAKKAGETGEVAPSWYTYEEEITDEILYNRNGLFSFAVHLSAYTGGAHGSYTVKGVVVDLTTGSVVKEEALFTDNYRAELTALLVNKIARNNHLDNPKDLETIGFFSIDEIAPNDNFSISDEGLTYYFNEYEIAAYVVGLTEVTLSYDEIKRLLRDDSPLLRMR